VTVVISAKLSLAVRLIDTTTGREVTEPDVRFYKYDRLIPVMRKTEGIYVIVNEGREDFPMRINVYGYDPYDVMVNFQQLDPRLPMLDVFLMPSEKNWVGGSVLEVCGTLSELEYIEAINLDRPIGLFQSLQEKKGVYTMNLLPVRTGGACRLDQISYALADETGERYHVFTVKEQEAPLRIILKDPFDKEHKLNDKIYRIIYGRAGPDGNFSLKVRDDSSDLPYLVHFKVGDDEYFRIVDFRNEHGEIDLMKDAIKAELMTGKEEVTDE
jgi:hypothetical protein